MIWLLRIQTTHFSSVLYSNLIFFFETKGFIFFYFFYDACSLQGTCACTVYLSLRSYCEGGDM